MPWSEVALKEALGDGAFGEVFAVEYAHTKCALKKLHNQTSQDLAAPSALLESLKSEFDVMMQLRHPHVLQMIGFASDGLSNYGILMELMEANSKRRALQRALHSVQHVGR